jgi:hypothetical protein
MLTAWHWVNTTKSLITSIGIDTTHGWRGLALVVRNTIQKSMIYS